MEEITDSDQARLSARQLALACLGDLGHTDQVTKLSLVIFDGLQSMHKMDQTERFWLECAALLHDIGWSQGAQSHHKKSMEMILDSQILPFENKEKLIIASIARYHRKALPSLSHDHYAVLLPAEREMVSKLSAILRIADGLDYSHADLVTDIVMDITHRKVIFHCTTTQSPLDEFKQALDKSDLFQEIFKRKVEFIRDNK
jgi:exopolyphosphatase/pppGpp-phosphohydrolase